MKHIVISIILLLLFTSGAEAQKIPTKTEILELLKISESALSKLDFEKSLKVARKALTYSFQINDNICIAHCYNEIAGNFEELAEFDKALEYYMYALKYAKKSKSLLMQDYIYNNKANIYFFDKKQYELGIENYKAAIECSTQNNDLKQTVLTKSNLAWAYFSVKDYKNAFINLNFINNNKKYFVGTSYISNLHMLNAMGYAARGDNKNADIFFLKAIDFAKNNDYAADLLDIYDEYTNYLYNIKDFERAYMFQKKQDEIKEKSYTKKFIANSQAVVKNIDLVVYKNEYLRSETENKIQKVIIRKTKIINSLFAAAVLFLILFLILLFRNNKFKLKSTKLLLSKNKQLEIANIKAVESANLKSQFVSTISHELRTPLYGVIGITNMLLDEQHKPVEKKHLQSLEFSANYLLSLVNDILHINKIEEKEFVMIKQNFDINEEVNLIFNSLSFSSENNNNIIEVNIDKNIPKLLVGDKMRLNQILINLLGNALKFTKNGKVTIDVVLAKQFNNSCFLDFKISDDGVGIAIEDQNKIYDKFVQVGKNNTDYQGTGLGLAIVKKLIHLFKSEIYLTSTPGIGTTFNFTIEFEINESLDQNLNLDKNVTKHQNLKILVVEDNKINQVVTKKIIEKYNSVCTVVDSGYKAIDLLEKEVFDIILMDINMPEINGYQTTEILRKKGVTTPIIALTAYSKNEIVDMAIKVGIDDILIKPFEPYKLFEMIEKQFDKKNAD